MDRMKELINALNKASKAYYQEDREIMTDFAYDKLYDELVALEKETGTTLAGSPTQNVGFTVLSNLTKVAHASRMLSLDKTKEVGKLKSFLGDQEGLLSWKLDGLTIVLKYNNGELEQAVTRGNGEIGEDITHNAKVFKNIPLKISFKGEMTIRGEAIILFSDFDRINEDFDDDNQYKNPRNLCSGTVRQLNSETTAGRNVRFYPFSLVYAEGKDFDDSKENQLVWVQSLGFETVSYQRVLKDEMEDTVEHFRSLIETNNFASDGLVLTYDSIAYSDSLGTTSKFPRDSIAFKWADEVAETVLLDVQWNTSRTGLINPIAIFKPVDLEGSTVSKASLHNVSVLENLQIGIGDCITVYKANMIIPQVAENLTKSGSLAIPENCSVCGFETEIRSLREGRALFCTNPNCKAQLVRSLSHFASRDAMNIEGLSEATLEKFVENKMVENYLDLYALEKYEEEIKSLEGFGVKSYDNLKDSLEKSKDVELGNFIYALGIHHVGLRNAKLLCKHFKDDIEKIKKASLEELVVIEGFGEIIANSLCKYFSDEKNMSLVNQTLEILRIVQSIQDGGEAEDKKFEGLTFVITGEVSQFKNRKEMQAYIESLGGKVTGSVTSKTNYLVNNDVDSSSAKNKKAKDLGVEIINEERLLGL